MTRSMAFRTPPRVLEVLCVLALGLVLFPGAAFPERPATFGKEGMRPSDQLSDERLPIPVAAAQIRCAPERDEGANAAIELTASEKPVTRANESTIDLGRSVLATYRSNLNRIRSVVVEVTGTETVGSPRAGGSPQKREIVGLVAFDLERRLWRNDKSRTTLYGKRFGARSLRTPDKDVFRHAGSGQISILPAGGLFSEESRAHPMSAVLDVRLAGVTLWAEFESAVITFDDRFDVYGMLDESYLTTATPEVEHLLKLEWTLSTFKRSIWFDRDRGMSPTRLELQCRSKDDGTDSWSAPFEVVRTEWTKHHSGLFVPVRVEFDRIPSQWESRSLSYRFAWKSLNAGVPPGLLSIDSFKHRGENVTVVDHRGDKPIIVELKDLPLSREWEKQYFNGRPYYIVPLEASDM